jgi:hypothetical protein
VATQLNLNQSVLVKDVVSTPSTPLRHVTVRKSDIVVKGSNFIHESTVPFNVCEGIVDFYYNNDSYKTHEGSHSGGQKDSNIKESVDISCNVDYGEFDNRIEQYFLHLDRQLKVYFNKFERSHMPCNITDKFNIQWYPPGGGYKIWHFERTEKRHSVRRHLVWMTYLTDNPDGGTEFLYQDLYVPAERGKTLIWPAEWTHTHRSRPDTKYEKMIITGWVEL